ncbi:MAG: glycosyltransferase family 4 protein [Anaerolineales bacterium]
MKIALIAPTSIPSRRANTIQVMKMAQALVLNGHDVHLAAPGDRSTLSGGFAKSKGAPLPMSKDADRPELKHHYGLTVEFPITWLPTKPRFRGYDYALRAVRFSQLLHADLLYTRHPQTAALSSLLSLPTIFEIHDLPQGQGKTLLRAFLKGPGQRRLIAITQALANALNRQSPIANLSILPDGVDLSRYYNLPNPETARALLVTEPLTFNLQPFQFTIGYTGHLYPGRGTDLLLTLAARLPEFHFLLVGGNPKDVHRLQNQITHHTSRIRNITLTGFIPNADLPRYQAACDLLLMPYQRRVAASSGGDIAPYLSPMKLFEYLAAGRAILSSDLPVFREVLNPENAVLLPPDDVDAWVNAIRDLHTHPEKRAALGARARQDAEKYTWEARAQKMLEGLG